VTNKRLKVSVVVPSMGMWDADFGASLVGVFQNFWQEDWPYKERDIILHSTMGSLLANNRLKAMRKAIALDCTHLLFVDSDQTFPQHTLRKLLSWNMPVVACNVATKQAPAGPTARLEGNVPLYTTPFDKDLVRVWRVGCGIMLVDLAVMPGVPEPWFALRWNPAAGESVGEDWFFCEQLEAAGVKLFVDQALSLDIGHVGRFCYDHYAVPTPLEVLDEKGYTEHLAADNHIRVNRGANAEKVAVHTVDALGLRPRIGANGTRRHY
jgi:hypothetical protein